MITTENHNNLAKPSAQPEDLAIEAIKSNYDVTIFSLIPAVDSRLQFLKSNGVKVGLSSAEVDQYMDLFVRAGFWVLDGTSIRTNFDIMDVGELSVQNYLEATLAIISRLSASGPCVYETSSIATTRELAKDFIQNVNKCFRQFYDQSNASDKSVIFSWAHAGLVVHENKSKLKNKTLNDE